MEFPYFLSFIVFCSDPMSVLDRSNRASGSLIMVFCFPTEGGGTEHGSIALFKFGKNDLGHSLLENWKQALIKSLFQRTHKQLTALCETSEENYGLRAGEGYHVGHGLSKYSASIFENLFGKFIACHGCVIYILRGDILYLQIAEGRRLRPDLKEFAGSAGNTRSAAICLKATRTAATASAPSTAARPTR